MIPFFLSFGLIPPVDKHAKIWYRPGILGTLATLGTTNHQPIQPPAFSLHHNKKDVPLPHGVERKCNLHGSFENTKGKVNLRIRGAHWSGAKCKNQSGLRTSFYCSKTHQRIWVARSSNSIAKPGKNQSCCENWIRPWQNLQLSLQDRRKTLEKIGGCSYLYPFFPWFSHLKRDFPLIYQENNHREADTKGRFKVFAPSMPQSGPKMRTARDNHIESLAGGWERTEPVDFTRKQFGISATRIDFGDNWQWKTCCLVSYKFSLKRMLGPSSPPRPGETPLTLVSELKMRQATQPYRCSFTHNLKRSVGKCWDVKNK